VLIIDAMRPAKVRRLLADLGAASGTEIETLVISHPHIDHYSGAGSLVRTYRVLKAVLSGPATFILAIDRAGMVA
jgi:glyoxylase-like metal-dependent hydrolase (beta-lactamase superfamily II)